MQKRRPHLCSLLLAGVAAGCPSPACPTTGSLPIVVPADSGCPTVAAAQSTLDTRAHAADEKVTGLAETTNHPAGTICWYRLDMGDLECVEDNRSDLMSGVAPQTDTIACDADGWLYGRPSPAGADACPPTIEPKSMMLPLVGADDYPARTLCVYDTSYPGVCPSDELRGAPLGPT